MEATELNDTYSVFYKEFKDMYSKDDLWIKEFIFYKGNLSNIDVSIDWRFKAVKGKRNQADFLGTCKLVFPIQYPLLLDNGTIVKN